MKKTLNEMTLEELWELFPIELRQYNENWSKWAEAEISTLYRILNCYTLTLSHIGSTSIPGILSKPIIDILAEVDISQLKNIKVEMERNGYICMAEGATRMSFNKGYTPEGYAQKVFHIHFHEFGDNEEILFRDYLRDHPTEAHEYEALKLRLLAKYGKDRDGYTLGKTDFVRRIINLSKAPGNQID